MKVIFCVGYFYARLFSYWNVICIRLVGISAAVHALCTIFHVCDIGVIGSSIK